MAAGRGAKVLPTGLSQPTTTGRAGYPAQVRSCSGPLSGGVPRMRFGILGALQVVRNGVELDLGRRQERLLLARLLVDANRTVSVDRLLDDLWGERPPATALGSLQALVSRLRRSLEPGRSQGSVSSVVVRRVPGYVLCIEPDALDAVRFESLAVAGRTNLDEGRNLAAVDAFDDALRLWRGDVLADFASERFVAPMAARFDALHLDVRERRAAALLAAGAASDAIADLESMTAADPLRQRPWELLLAALHEVGRTVEALDRHRRLRVRFADELGLDLGAGLQAVEQQLLRGVRLVAADRSDAGSTGVAAAPATAGVPREGQIAADGVAPLGVATTAGALGEMIGRRREQDLLERVLWSALAGATSWAVVVGEAGIGKTRLAEHLAARATTRGVRSAFGRCHEADVTPAYWPWVQTLRSVEDLVPDAAAMLAAADREGGDSAAHLFGLFERVGQVLREAASYTPLLVVLEDLHWADLESLRLIDYLAVQLRDAPILFVLTSRRVSSAIGLGHTLGELARLPGHARVELSGLDTSATAELVATMTGTEVDNATAEALRQRTGGNPFFVTELARLGEEAMQGARLPDTVREVLSRRLATLPEDTAALLTLAAVLGAEFTLDALVAVSELSEASVIDQLDVAMTADLVVSADDPVRFGFAHALIREAVLDGLTDLRRRRLHLHTAISLRSIAPDEPAAWRAEIAHHLLAAAPLGDPSDALRAARAAAQLAEQRLAFHEAARWWAGALRVLDWDRRLGTDLRLRHDLLVALGRALADAGDRPSAIQRLAQAIDVAEQLGDARAMAEAAIGFQRTCGCWHWTVYGGDRPVDLLARVDRTLAALGDADPALRVRVLEVCAAGEYYGDQTRGRGHAVEALAIAQRSGEPEIQARALVTAMRINWSHHDVPQLQTWAHELLEVSSTHDLAELELLARICLMSWWLIEGDLVSAEDAYRRAVALSERLGLVVYQAQLAWSAPLFPLARGDLTAAERLRDDARELHAGTRLYGLDIVTVWNRLLLLWETGRLDEISPADRSRMIADFPEGEVAMLLHDGDRQDARRLLTAICQQRPHRPLFDALGLAVVRARLAADLDAVDLAPGLEAELAPYSTYLGAIGTCATAGPVATQLGRLRTLLDDHDGAVATLTQSVQRAEASQWPLWAAQARQALTTAVDARANRGEGQARRSARGRLDEPGAERARDARA